MKQETLNIKTPIYLGDYIEAGILVLLTALGLLGIYLGVKRNYAYVFYFAFSLFFLMGAGVWGEGITIHNQGFSIDTSTSTVTGTFSDGTVTTGEDAGVLAIAWIYTAAGILGSLYTLTRYRADNVRGSFDETGA